MGFFAENWLWRGTQSAIFYYVSCSPCIERKYKRKRRNEAERAQKQREEVIATQPGQIQQPGAFQTNEEWAEEILMGPGPPKGWKRDSVAGKLSSTSDKATTSTGSTDNHVVNVQSGASDGQNATDVAHTTQRTVPDTDAVDSSAIDSLRQADSNGLISGPIAHHADTQRRSTETSVSSSTLSSDPVGQQNRPRPSLERRLSTAMDNLRDTIRSTMRPENWNWIRYERDDEILSGFNQRVTEMWNRATNFGMGDKRNSGSSSGDTGENATSPSALRKPRRRASTIDSDRFDYQKYTRNPEINELHPPVVSRLPATRDEAAWMVLPPPSAAIMEGKVRPKDETALRWPLTNIGRTSEEWKILAQNEREAKNPIGRSQPDSIPELSDSFTEASLSDEDVLDPHPKRHSVPMVDSERPIGLDLLYVKSRSVAQDRSDWPMAQQV